MLNKSLLLVSGRVLSTLTVLEIKAYFNSSRFFGALKIQ